MYLLEGVAYIKWDKDIEELCHFLQDKLRAPDLYIDTDQDPPHDPFITGEALFFEINVNQINSPTDYQYEIIISSQMMGKTWTPDGFHDVSPWLVKWLQISADLEAIPGNLP